jgi:hypothetical protein
VLPDPLLVARNRRRRDRERRRGRAIQAVVRPTSTALLVLFYYCEWRSLWRGTESTPGNSNDAAGAHVAACCKFPRGPTTTSACTRGRDGGTATMHVAFGLVFTACEKVAP